MFRQAWRAESISRRYRRIAGLVPVGVMIRPIDADLNGSFDANTDGWRSGRDDQPRVQPAYGVVRLAGTAVLAGDLGEVSFWRGCLDEQGKNQTRDE